MKEDLPSTVGSLTSYLETLKIRVQNGELSRETFEHKEKEISTKIDEIIRENEFNGIGLLNGNETVSLTISEDTFEIKVEDNSNKK